MLKLTLKTGLIEPKFVFINPKHVGVGERVMIKDATDLIARAQRLKSRRNVSPPTGERNVRQLPEGTVRPSCPHCGATRNSVTDSRAAPLGEGVTMRRVRE